VRTYAQENVQRRDVRPHRWWIPSIFCHQRLAYSTVPLVNIDHHSYEKMLYDQAQIITSLCETFQISQDPFFVTKAAETADYVLSKLNHPLGGFYCAEDADSLPSKDSKKSQEGAFYVWTADELRKLLDQDYPSIPLLHLNSSLCLLLRR
jgi:hypothetical protein